MRYPDWMWDIALEAYSQGLSTHQVSALTGITQPVIYRRCKRAGITRSISEARKGKYIGELAPSWTGDKCGNRGQHIRAMKDIPHIEDFWCIPCLLRDGIYKKAEERARIDHTNLPYRIDYVMPMCRSCNTKHNLFSNGNGGRMTGGFVILFQEVS